MELYIAEPLHICLHITVPVALGLFQVAVVVHNKEDAALWKEQLWPLDLTVASARTSVPGTEQERQCVISRTVKAAAG